MRFFLLSWFLVSWFLAACILPAPAVAAPWHLTKVQMVGRSSGWALAATPRGSVLLRTTNGGASWQNVSPHGIWPLSPAQIAANENFAIGWEGIDFQSLSGQDCWAAMISRDTQIIVEQTHDGGHHWEKSQFANRSGYSLLLSFLDRRHGWLLTISDMASGSTKKELYRTEDGGQTWAAVTDVIPDHIDPLGMTFRSASKGWLAAGYHGSDGMPFYRTDDRGRHWRLQELDTSSAFADGEGYGEAGPPSFFGPGRHDGLLPVQFHCHFPAVGVYRTRDGGDTWRLIRSSPLLTQEGFPLFTSLKTGWMMKDRDTPAPKLLRTQDGGRHWLLVYPKQENHR